MNRFFVLLFMAVLLLGCTQSAPQPSATPQPSIQASIPAPTPTPVVLPPDARKTFTNAAAGISFRYEDSWESVKDEGEDAVSLAQLQRPPYEEFRIIGPIPTEDEVQAGAEEYFSALESTLNLSRLSGKTQSIGGLNAYRLKASTKVEGQSLTILLIGVQSTKKPIRNYFVYVGASSKTFEQNEAEYDAMAQSFKLN